MNAQGSSREDGLWIRHKFAKLRQVSAKVHTKAARMLLVYCSGVLEETPGKPLGVVLPEEPS